MLKWLACAHKSRGVWDIPSVRAFETPAGIYAATSFNQQSSCRPPPFDTNPQRLPVWSVLLDYTRCQALNMTCGYACLNVFQGARKPSTPSLNHQAKPFIYWCCRGSSGLETRTQPPIRTHPFTPPLSNDKPQTPSPKSYMIG